eukprot:IDg8079t1
MSSRAAASSSSSSSKSKKSTPSGSSSSSKKKSGGASSSKKGAPKKSGASSSARAYVPSEPIAIPRNPLFDSHVPLSTSFTRDDIIRSVGRPDDFYPKVGDHESVNTLHGDIKFLPPHIIGQREREKEIARSYDNSRRRYHSYY